MSHKQASQKRKWGLLPDEVRATLKAKKWQNPRQLKRLLKGEAEFPLTISLKPPTGREAIECMEHLQTYVSAWRSFSIDMADLCKGCQLKTEKRSFRLLENQELPIKLVIQNIEALTILVGENAQQALKRWQNTIRTIFESVEVSSQQQKPLFNVLIDHLELIERYQPDDLSLLVKLIPQLSKGMGQGGYLKSLPVLYVDTKFIERNLKIIESMVAVLIDEQVSEIGLLKWLDCQPKPKDWLLVKPLCKESQTSLGGLPLLRLSSDVLQSFELPAKNILVIENEQSCLALSNIPDTIAVSGGGKNIAWLSAEWLRHKNVGYWGDIDSEGLSILSDVRRKLSQITPLMMDEETVKAYENRMVEEPNSVEKVPIGLNNQEQLLFKKLRQGEFIGKRLEQERLPFEYVKQKIERWRI